MENFYINNLLKNLCCSVCRADFDHYKILRQEKNILVLNLICSNCGKDFGTCFLSMCDMKYRKNSIPLDLQDGPDMISADEVLDANLLIKNLEADWTQHLPKQTF